MVLHLLRDGNAHVSFERAVGVCPKSCAGRLPDSPWQQLEHLWITQWDILEPIRTPPYLGAPLRRGPSTDVPGDAVSSRWQWRR